ncbi:serine/threonine-protein kinase [Microbacterium sp. 16-032]|uniref:serine/threonine-protein kinase n=1 Tax=Microbacterium sp. 16-032 TaxID=3239808 RepID=UPI0034E1B854
MSADKDTLEVIARQIIPDTASLGHLGTGGFACTFKVEGDGQPYALKVIDPGLSEAARVERELDALRRVNHPGVVQFIDHGDHEHDGVTYKWIKMAFVQGHSLRQALGGGQVFDVMEALQLVRALVDAASAIWEQRTAHRDLSPGNILLQPNNVPVIVDLGLARHVDDETLTELPTPGTPGWMSPEQVKTSPTHGDWRSDQFVIGALGYLFLTNVQPFYAPNLMDRWVAPATRAHQPIRSVDNRIPQVAADVVERMLEKLPYKRYLRPQDLLADLDRAILALQNTEAPDSSPQRFFVNISQVKNFAENGYLSALRPAGVIVDSRATSRLEEFFTAAHEADANAILDPVTHFVQSPREARPAGFRRLPYGDAPVLTGFSDDDARTEWCQAVLDQSMEPRPDVVISPYFFAGEGSGSWVTETLACASKYEELMAARSEENRAEIWTGVAVHSSWLANQQYRNTLLNQLTGQPMKALYLLIATNQPPLGPLADVEVLAGLHELLTVFREAAVPVVVGKRASSGLLLLALGAQGWGSGVSGNLMNMTPPPEAVEPGGGSAIDRIYVPQLLNHITVPSYVLMRATEPELVELNTPYALQLFMSNPDLEELSTEDRILLNRHNIYAQQQQVSRLDALPTGQRIATLRDWISGASEAYRVLPPTRLPSEGPGFLASWTATLN